MYKIWIDEIIVEYFSQEVASFIDDSNRFSNFYLFYVINMILICYQ